MVSLSLNKLKLDMFITYFYLYLILFFYGTIRITDAIITLSTIGVTIYALKVIIVINVETIINM